MKRLNIFKSLMISYLLITLIPLMVITAVVMRKNHALYLERLIESRESEIKQVTDSIELRIRECNALAYKIYQSPNLTRILMSNARSSAFEGVRELKTLSDSNEFIENIALCYLGEDRLYTAMGLMRMNVFLEQCVNLGPDDAHAFTAMFEERRFPRYFADSGLGKFVYLVTLPLNASKPDRVLLFHISESAMSVLFDNLSKETNDLHLMLDGNGAPVYTDDYAGLDGADFTSAALESGADVAIGGAQYRVLMRKGVVSSLTLVTFIPMSSMSLLSESIGYLGITAAGVFIICLLLSLLFTEQHLRPVRKLRHMVGGGSEGRWEEIHSSIEQTIERNQHLFTELTYQRALYRETCVLKLFYGNVEQMDLEALRAHLALLSPIGVMCVLAICPRSTDAGPTDGSVYQAVMNAIAGAKNLDIVAVEIGQEKSIAAVLFIPPDTRSDAPDEAIERLIALIRPLNPPGYLVGVGRVAESPGAVRTAYLQAQAVLRTLKSGAGDEVGVTLTYFDEMVRGETTLPDIHEREIYLMLALDQGDRSLAAQMFREILASVNRASRPMMNYTCIRLLERIMPEAIGVEGLDADGLARELMDTINASMGAQFESGMLGVIDAICRKNEARNAQKSDRQKNEVIAFVLQHYDNNALSLEYLSAHFGFSSYYWSRYFKESIGQNFSEYVWQLRLTRAKELLASTLSVAEVVERVGYLDVRSFIRKFKNSEGITPAQYKRDKLAWQEKWPGHQKLP